MNIDTSDQTYGSVPMDDTPRVDPLHILTNGSHKPVSCGSSVGTSAMETQHDASTSKQHPSSIPEERDTPTSLSCAEKTDAQPIEPIGGHHAYVHSTTQLDEFGATEAEFQEELKEEYSKLSDEKK